MSKSTKGNPLSRREFVTRTMAATAGFTIVPSFAVSGLGHMAPSDKLNIAGIGIGGMGFDNLKKMETENIVGLCDVDWKYADRVFKHYPNAKKYKDFRKMYEEMGKSIDAIVVATADHTHAIVSADAMTMGKHVYLQKPLTHTVYESRLLTKLADKHKLATQMGNQGASAEGVSLVCEWIANNEIGEITRVEAFTDRPIWPQGQPIPNAMTAPSTLDWDLFVGPAKMRDYSDIYTPWNWRGWWDFGTGALGDMACHILHPVFVGLELGYPTAVQGSSTMLLTDSAPSAQKVSLTFPKRMSKSNKELPQVQVEWYDGGLQPDKPMGWPAGKDMNNNGGGVIFHGTKDKIICGCYGRDPWLLSGRKPTSPKFRRRIDVSHEQDWIRACKETPANRVETSSPFSEAGPFNEMVVMGVLAVRLQSLNKELAWDGKNMKFTNIGADETIRIIKKDNFKIHDGHPTFDRDMTDPINANAFAEELIKHNYRNGWKLPDMPV